MSFEIVSHNICSHLYLLNGFALHFVLLFIVLFSYKLKCVIYPCYSELFTVNRAIEWLPERCTCTWIFVFTLQLRHNECDGISTTSVCSTVGSCADQRKHQSSASLAFVWGVHRWPVNYPHKRPVTRKMFPFDDVIVKSCCFLCLAALGLWCSIEHSWMTKCRFLMFSFGN